MTTQDKLADALHVLLAACDDSDSAMYGTLGVSFVRDVAQAAIAEHDAKAAAPDAPAPVQVAGAVELPPLPHGDAFCDIADWNEESIGMCGAWSEHLSINSRYTMPLYTESSVRTYARAAIAALQQKVTLREVTIHDAVRFSLPLDTLRTILPHGIPATGSEGEGK